jgi:hypothetical protein
METVSLTLALAAEHPGRVFLPAPRHQTFGRLRFTTKLLSQENHRQAKSK